MSNVVDALKVKYIEICACNFCSQAFGPLQCMVDNTPCLYVSSMLPILPPSGIFIVVRGSLGIFLDDGSPVPTHANTLRWPHHKSEALSVVTVIFLPPHSVDRNCQNKYCYGLTSPNRELPKAHNIVHWGNFYSLSSPTCCSYWNFVTWIILGTHKYRYGESVGDLDVVDGAARTVTAIALEEGCLLVQVLQCFYGWYPAFLWRVMGAGWCSEST
jgi:hypothetical protein